MKQMKKITQAHNCINFFLVLINCEILKHAKRIQHKHHKVP